MYVSQEYATEGLRTLCIAYRDVPDAEYREWSAIYDQAAHTINGRGEALDGAAELIEKDMFLLGATAIEDKLQDGVPDTIHTLQMAGIKVWVLTGDRQETAINIGMSCRLISESMNLVWNTLSGSEPCDLPVPRSLSTRKTRLGQRISLKDD
jgi:phospholipid-transporting ATPase